VGGWVEGVEGDPKKRSRDEGKGHHHLLTNKEKTFYLRGREGPKRRVFIGGRIHFEVFIKGTPPEVSKGEVKTMRTSDRFRRTWGKMKECWALPRKGRYVTKPRVQSNQGGENGSTSPSSGGSHRRGERKQGRRLPARAQVYNFKRRVNIKKGGKL